MSPEEFLKAQHYYKFSFFGWDIVLGQPSSALIILVLLSVYLVYAIRFSLQTQGHVSRKLWCTGLFLSSVTCLIAGIYYQAFGYHIRCEGLAKCYTISSWETLYYILSSLSSFSYYLAITWSSTQGQLRRALKLIGVSATLLYLFGLGIGRLSEVMFLLSFEFSVLMTLPMILPITLINLFRYFRRPRTVDKVLLYSSLMLVVTSVSYFAYFGLGLTKLLWSHGIWFSENDVLHIGLIFWSWFLNHRLLKILRDTRL